MENWKVIKGFEEYEVSDLGRVRRIPGAERRGTNAANGVLKQGANHKGYFMVWLSKESKQYTRSVHRLVAEAFLPNPKNMPQVNHKEGNKADNRVVSLEWSDQVKNMQHASRLGIMHGDGVYQEYRGGKWIAQFCPKPRQRKYLGTFTTKEEALKARREAIEAM